MWHEPKLPGTCTSTMARSLRKTFDGYFQTVDDYEVQKRIVRQSMLSIYSKIQLDRKYIPPRFVDIIRFVVT